MSVLTEVTPAAIYQMPTGLTITTRVSAADTGGIYCLAEIVTPRFAGPMPHHHHHAETFVVLEGEFEFQVGAACIGAGPGATITVPPNVSHAFRNLSPHTGRLLLLSMSGAIEDAWKAAHQHPLDLDLVLTARRYGIEFD